MNPISILTSLAKEILKDEIDYFNLKKELENYKNLLYTLTEIEIENPINSNDIHFNNGIALSTKFAALCIDDLIRTRQLIRGLFKAVEKVKSKEKPVTILYAGTGPFAALALPLISIYTSKQVQLVLMEINPQTITCLKKTIKKLGIKDYISEIIQEDASTCVLKDATKIDILISETMQHALVKEQQVPIFFNLVTQLNKNTIIIPNAIHMDLAVLGNCSKNIIENTNGKNYKEISKLWCFDKSFIEEKIKIGKLPKNNTNYTLIKDINYKEYISQEYRHLAILTSIHIFDNEWIHFNESGLTIPKILFDVTQQDQSLNKVSLNYKITETPHYTYTLS